MLFFPNAKINVGLHVINRRSDGFHNIETVFVPVGLSDVLEFVPSDEMHFSTSGVEVDSPPEKNLCIKAWNLLSGEFSLPPVDIHLHKMIPPGAGLGGGSSDAAFMLKYMNSYFDLKLGENDLCRYASQLGSDCAFFIKNRPLLGYERGNVFGELKFFPGGLQVAIVNPGIHVSTAEAYAGITPGKPLITLGEQILMPLSEWKHHIRNDFETSIFEKHPRIAALKEKMYEIGAVYASMSGSGSSVYGLFEKKSPEIDVHFPGMFCWTGTVIQTQS
jgi:4-diphosphocytidyl-2-C-methyl-D-erythritol kinase